MVPSVILMWDQKLFVEASKRFKKSKIVILEKFAISEEIFSTGISDLKNEGKMKHKKYFMKV